ncbi:hypothetical protein JX265_013061 [Neoarthrinium moseri]|uniref:Uncharacterized protein n=1 Tax=Neoarthrinium moseri TaxID=1658444 RepID=A0A9Q0AI10_9PEZI|nr:hypothetical protein JX265_013061 [Neoarthrinium moseri]
MPASEFAYITQPSAMVGTTKHRSAHLKASHKSMAPSEYSYDSDDEIAAVKAQQSESRPPQKASILSKIKAKIDEKVPKQPTQSNTSSGRNQARADTAFAYKVIAGALSVQDGVSCPTF